MPRLDRSSTARLLAVSPVCSSLPPGTSFTLRSTRYRGLNLLYLPLEYGGSLAIIGIGYCTEAFIVTQAQPRSSAQRRIATRTRSPIHGDLRNDLRFRLRREILQAAPLSSISLAQPVDSLPTLWNRLRRGIPQRPVLLPRSADRGVYRLRERQEESQWRDAPVCDCSGIWVRVG